MGIRKKIKLGVMVYFGSCIASWAGPSAAVAEARTMLFQGALPAIPIREFHEVSPGIFRGSRPEGDGVRALSEMGIRTDLDLEDAADVVDAERQSAVRSGIAFISMPMNGFFAPRDSDVHRILEILDDPRNYPIYVHCQHGHDRTGLIIGLYRVFYQRWSPASAYQEMLRMHFHPILLGLHRYYEEKTGYEDWAF